MEQRFFRDVMDTTVYGEAIPFGKLPGSRLEGAWHPFQAPGSVSLLQQTDMDVSAMKNNKPNRAMAVPQASPRHVYQTIPPTVTVSSSASSSSSSFGVSPTKTKAVHHEDAVGVRIVDSSKDDEAEMALHHAALQDLLESAPASDNEDGDGARTRSHQAHGKRPSLTSHLSPVIDVLSTQMDEMYPGMSGHHPLSAEFAARRPSLDTDHHGRPRLSLSASNEGNNANDTLPSFPFKPSLPRPFQLNLSPRAPTISLNGNRVGGGFGPQLSFLSQSSIWSNAPVFSPPTQQHATLSSDAPERTSPAMNTRVELELPAPSIPATSSSPWLSPPKTFQSPGSLLNRHAQLSSPLSLESRFASLSLKRRSKSANMESGPSHSVASELRQFLPHGIDALDEVAVEDEREDDNPVDWQPTHRRAFTNNDVFSGHNGLNRNSNLNDNSRFLKPRASPTVPRVMPLSPLLQSQHAVLSGMPYGVPPAVSSSTNAHVDVSYDANDLFIVQFKGERRDLFYVAETDALQVNMDDLVIVEADRGHDLGRVVAKMFRAQQRLCIRESWRSSYPAGLGLGNLMSSANLHPKRIFRIAQPSEIDLLVSKAHDEAEALLVCQTKVRQRNLPIYVIDGEYQWDRKKLTFYYQSKQRIDFRELVRDLFKVYKTRIWMCAINSAAWSTSNQTASVANSTANTSRRRFSQDDAAADGLGRMSYSPSAASAAFPSVKLGANSQASR
ncbi:PSP1 family protein [Schizosaccharomyces japonicus yFS275]|uniref:PSP1 family protein n=1 Tax=Schizosaccharomyces japonicus (strain yFS275 / FY16936) TaxID=402676 RepID=B6K7H4_SCHJY|nr:PSP1 family protein [Schizosaccharomyces japonicus yFS275]EEB09478.2 PSP1 family protein [Schizosaccharomyces japonicus yFS275]